MKVLLLLCGLLSGLTSPSRTTLTCCSLSTKLVNLDFLTLPTGTNKTLKRAGVTIDKGSRLMLHQVVCRFSRSPREKQELYPSQVRVHDLCCTRGANTSTIESLPKPALYALPTIKRGEYLVEECFRDIHC